MSRRALAVRALSAVAASRTGRLQPCEETPRTVDGTAQPPTGQRRKYAGARDALIALWEASDRVCGKRLVAMIPALLPALERHGRLQPTSEERGLLLSVSAATIDRMLVDVKIAAAGGRRRRVGFYSAIRREVPIRPMKHDDFVQGALAINEGRRLLSWSNDKTLRVWELRMGQEVSPTMQQDGPVRGAVFSPDERYVLSWSDKFMYLWDVTRRQLIGSGEAQVRGALFTHGGQQFLLGDTGGFLWERYVATGEIIEPSHPLPWQPTLQGELCQAPRFIDSFGRLARVAKA